MVRLKGFGKYIVVKYQSCSGRGKNIRAFAHRLLFFYAGNFCILYWQLASLQWGNKSNNSLWVVKELETQIYRRILALVWGTQIARAASNWLLENFIRKRGKWNSRKLLKTKKIWSFLLEVITSKSLALLRIHYPTHSKWRLHPRLVAMPNLKQSVANSTRSIAWGSIQLVKDNIKWPE